MPEQVASLFSTRYSLLTTWILWRNLLHPHDPPLFRRTLRLPLDATPVPQTSLVWVILLLSTLACCGLIQLHSALTILLPIALMALSSSYVIVWVIRVTDTIRREMDHGAYDQFSVTPSGALGASWALAAAALHRGDAIGWIDAIRKVFTTLLLIALIAILVTTTLRQNDVTLAQFSLLLVEMTALAAATYVDHVHTLLLGSLVGMLSATHAASSLDARLEAVLVFLSLQALTCATTLLAPLVLLPALFALIHWDFPFNPLIVGLIVFFGTRELLIVFCWQALARQLNANASEYRFWN